MLRLFVLVLALATATPALARDAAQSAPATLKVVVVDQTGAALITASVTVTDPAGTSRMYPVDDRGEVTLSDLAVGTYTVRADAEAFESFEGPVTLKRGANTVTISLPLAGLSEEVVVVMDTESPSGGFVSTLSEQEIAELPDDPEELEQVLMQMAGPGATMRVNGFRGGRLPPKSQIQQVRFRMNSYAAENHEAGGFGIDIITRPGMDGWRGMTNFGFRDEALNARNAFAPSLGPEQYRRFGINMDGPLKKGKTSLALNFDGNANYDSQTIVATTPDGDVNDTVRRPNDRFFGSVRLDHQLTPSQLMRIEVRGQRNEQRNLGVGDFDLLSRAYERTASQQSLRFSLNGVVAPRIANELKVRIEQGRTEQFSLSTEPAIVVIDAFATGGAGQQSDRRSRLVEIEDNVDFELGKKHRLRTGVLLEGAWYDSDELRNGNGTWTFGSLEQYLLGQAATYTRRVGGTQVSYSQYQGAWYIQDDYTPFKSLALSVGLRHEVQSHLDDVWNLAPRFGFTWTPGRFTVRGGYGIFYDWFDSGTYEQTLRMNGLTQQEIVIRNPVYPDLTGGITGEVLPPSRYQTSPGLEMPYVHQASVGVERTFFDGLRVMTMYTMTRGRNQLRARNVNAPVLTDAGFVRPDPSLGNVVELESTGRSEVDRLMVNVNYGNPARRLFMGVNYQLSRSMNHTDNPFSLPANNYDLDAEWGPSSQDARHRLFAMINFGLPKQFRMGVFTQAQSALPYNIITGFDDNGDTVVNDRPAGVGRNSARGAASWNLNMRLSRSFGFGPERETTAGPRMRGGGGGRGPRGGGGGGPMMMAMDGTNTRYRVEFYVQAFNVLNRTNLLGFSGNQLSRYFGTATSAGPARRIELGMSFGF